MPMEIRRFGVGHRRPERTARLRRRDRPGHPHRGPRLVIAELAFERGGRIEPHTNPNTTWFIVIEGGGLVLVGDEQARVAAGEAVLWPAGIDPRRVDGLHPDAGDRRGVRGSRRQRGPGDRWAGALERGSPAAARRTWRQADGALAPRNGQPAVSERDRGRAALTGAPSTGERARRAGPGPGPSRPRP